MQKQEIIEILKASLGNFVASLEREGVEIMEKTCPIRDLGLTSADGVDWACDLEDMGFNIPQNANPFFADLRSPERNVEQMAEYLLSVPYNVKEM